MIPMFRVRCDSCGFVKDCVSTQDAESWEARHIREQFTEETS